MILDPLQQVRRRLGNIGDEEGFVNSTFLKFNAVAETTKDKEEPKINQRKIDHFSAICSD